MCGGSFGEDAIEIEVVLPAHNEEGSIGDVLEEFHGAAVASGLRVRFVVAEDGSRDRTREVVTTLAETLPIILLPAAPRKGYSRAVVDGLQATTAALVAFSDSDGQCDPADLKRLYDALGDNDLVVGYRNPRHDTPFRKFISGAFKFVYQRRFPVRLRDPSCPFLLVRREAVAQILRGNPGILRQGFWWEFNARAAAVRLKVAEVPVNHRERFAGQTQVYRLSKLPRIASEHLRALGTLRKELRAIHIR
jgi:glycosyltransferase involved in cell wall biosynthesis